MSEPAQRYVCGRTREPLRARQFNRRHSQPLDVARMSDRSHRNPIVNFEDLLSRSPECDKQDSVGVTQGRNRAARSQLRFNVFAAIRNRLDPAIRFLDHATSFLKISPIRASERVRIPSRETIFKIGNIRAFRSTPPVAVSLSAAVSRARKAMATASSSLVAASGLSLHLLA